MYLLYVCLLRNEIMEKWGQSTQKRRVEVPVRMSVKQALIRLINLDGTVPIFPCDFIELIPN